MGLREEGGEFLLLDEAVADEDDEDEEDEDDEGIDGGRGSVLCIASTASANYKKIK